MSRLKTQLDEALVLNRKMHAELERRAPGQATASIQDNSWYEAYDEYKADAYEAAVDLLDSILDAYAAEEPGIVLRFGDGADTDTFNGVFGHLANGYTIEVNGQDMVCLSTGNDPMPGLYGLAWDDEEGEATDKPVGVSWEDLESVTIY